MEAMSVMIMHIVQTHTKVTHVHVTPDISGMVGPVDVSDSRLYF